MRANGTYVFFIKNKEEKTIPFGKVNDLIKLITRDGF